MVLHTKKMVIRLLTQADSEAEIKTKQKHRLLHICPVSSELKRCPPPPALFLFKCAECRAFFTFPVQNQTPFPPSRHYSTSVDGDGDISTKLSYLPALPCIPG